MSAFSLTPWTASMIPSTPPPLPKILDPTLEAAAFIHASCGSGRLTDLSYERLEWVGDAYLYLTSTLLISQTFPSLLPGKCSQLRERLVKNITLADFARQYGFEQRAVFSVERANVWDSAKDHDKTKILGDIFEAYVAAVVLSDPKDGVVRVSEWLKGLWGMTIRKEILTEERSGVKMDSPLWRLRGDAAPIEIISSEPKMLSAKDQLVRTIGAKGVKITYRDAAPQKKDKNSRLLLFTVGVYLDGWGEKDKQLGFGAANGKKEAGMKAAEMALGNKKLMKVYMEKKRIFDEQMELERELLKKQADVGDTS
jgi:ribonuclease-3